MGTRLELQTLLESVLGEHHVYFQPPASMSMKYPAIVFSRDDIQNRFADNNIYTQSIAYSVTVIDEDPDSPIVERVSHLPKCRYDRHFESDNLNHDVFVLYY